MGCSNTNQELININPNEIVNVSYHIYKDELELKNLLEKNLTLDDKPQEYFLIKKFWKYDFMEFFECKGVIEQVKNFSEEDILKNKKYMNDKKIDELINKIRFKHNIPKQLTNISYSKINIITLNNGKELFPDLNTLLIKENVFDLMKKILIEYDSKNIVNIIRNKSNVLIGNNNIYLFLDENNNINKSKNLIICFLDKDNLRSKYFINFYNENNINEIIQKYIINNYIESYINKSCKNKMKEIEIKIDNKIIGFFVNLIPEYDDDDEDQKEDNKNNNNDISNDSNYSLFGKNELQTKGLINEWNPAPLTPINQKENNNLTQNDKNQDTKKDKKNLMDENIEMNQIIYKNNEISNNNDINNNINNKINNITPNIINDNNNLIDNNYDNIINNNIEKEINNISFNNEKYPIKRIKKMNSFSFINEFLQCLTNLDIIKEFYLNNENIIKKESKKITPFSIRLINTIKYVFNKDLNVNDNILDDNFFINNYNQEYNDITFIEFLFKKLEEELKDIEMSLNEDNIRSIFYGQRYYEYQCIDCKNKNIKTEYYFYLKFDIKKVFEFYKNRNKNIKTINLKDCFNYYKKYSKDFCCEKCKNHNLKIITCEFHSLPEIIILIFENGDFNILKNETYIKSNALMDNNDIIYYDLICQINKKENNDYITYLKSYNDLKWYICLNDNIIECNENELKKDVPYFLIFQKTKDLPKNKYIDESDNSIVLHEKDNLDLIFYSTVSKIKERLDNLDSNMKIEEVYNLLCEKYKFEKCSKLLFCNSRKLDIKKSIKENNLENGDFIIIVEYNFN